MSTGALPPEHTVDSWNDLCLFLGGSVDSFTGLLLRLTQKADPVNRQRLMLGFAREVMAFELWSAASEPYSAEGLDRAIGRRFDDLLADL